MSRKYHDLQTKPEDAIAMEHLPPRETDGRGRQREKRFKRENEK